MSVILTCTPGPQVSAALRQAGGVHALVVQLDPGVLTLSVPPFPGAPEVFARFYRQLGRESLRFAELLDGQPVTCGRHAASWPG